MMYVPRALCLCVLCFDFDFNFDFFFSFLFCMRFVGLVWFVVCCFFFLSFWFFFFVVGQGNCSFKASRQRAQSVVEKSGCRGRIGCFFTPNCPADCATTLLCRIESRSEDRREEDRREGGRTLTFLPAHVVCALCLFCFDFDFLFLFFVCVVLCVFVFDF